MEQIIALMRLHKVSRRQMTTDLGIGWTTFWRWERGKAKVSHEMWEKMVKYLGYESVLISKVK